MRVWPEGMISGARSRLAMFVALAAAGFGVSASAQSVTLTEGAGRPLIIGGATDLGGGLTPVKLAPQAIVAEFQRLCLPEPATASTRISGSALSLESDDVVFAAAGKQQEAHVAQWRGPSALLSVWTGDDANLKNRPIAIASRGYSVNGSYGSFHATGSQCNLVVMLPDFASVTALSGALSAAFGVPGKLVIKNTFADGYWSVAGATSAIRINFTAPSAQDGPHPAHLSAQLQEKDSNR